MFFFLVLISLVVCQCRRMMPYDTPESVATIPEPSSDPLMDGILQAKNLMDLLQVRAEYIPTICKALALDVDRGLALYTDLENWIYCKVAAELFTVQRIPLLQNSPSTAQIERALQLANDDLQQQLQHIQGSDPYSNIFNPFFNQPSFQTYSIPPVPAYLMIDNNLIQREWFTRFFRISPIFAGESLDARSSSEEFKQGQLASNPNTPNRRLRCYVQENRLRFSALSPKSSTDFRQVMRQIIGYMQVASNLHPIDCVDATAEGMSVDLAEYVQCILYNAYTVTPQQQVKSFPWMDDIPIIQRFLSRTLMNEINSQSVHFQPFLIDRASVPFYRYEFHFHMFEY